MTNAERTKARKTLKKAHGAGLTSTISEATGISKVYIRRWFVEEEIVQPSIEAEVIEMLRALKAKEQQVQELLK